MTSNELQNWRAGGEYLETSKGKVFVRSGGSGPVLLLVHGFPTSSWDWHAVAPHMQKYFNVITIDMLGYGFSDKPKDIEYSTSMQVELINQVLKQKSITSVHLISYSYGVSVVQEMLVFQQSGRFEAHIESLCFMNGGLFPQSNHPNLSQKLMLGCLGGLFVNLMNKGSLKRNLSSIFGPRTQPSQKLIDQYWELINFNGGRKLIPKLIQYLHERKKYMHQWEAALKSSICPIQLIIGDQDAISGLEVAEEFKAKIGSNNVHILEGIGHYPQLECPQIVCELYFDFSNSV